MAKRHSVKSYLMLAKFHSKRKDTQQQQQQQQQTETKKRKKSSKEESGQDNFGAQTSDERNTTTTNESIQTANSTGGDSSSGYQSVAANGHHTNGANQFYPAPSSSRHQHQHHQSQQRLSATERLQATATDGMKQPMVNERITGEKRMWSSSAAAPAMIDDQCVVNENNNNNNNNGLQQQRHLGKVHLIDDDAIDVRIDEDDDVDVDIDIDSYDIDCVAAAANEDNNNISDRFHRHRYCVDSNASPASRFDESFQLERQRLHHQQLQANPHRQHQQQQQQYFHQPPSNYQQQPLSLNSSQFQPSQHPSLLNGAAYQQQQQQQQQRFVNYIAHQPAADLYGQHQYPTPPTNYSQQQYHTLVHYQPHPHLLPQYPYTAYSNYTTTNQHLQRPVSSKPSSSTTADDSSAANERRPSDSSNQQQPSLSLGSYHHLVDPGAGSKMHSASSRQYLTSAAAAVANNSHHYQQQHHHHKQSNSRRNHHQQSSAVASSGQGRKHVNNSSKPSLDCCGKLAKFMLFTTNILFWSAGIALGAWGILSLVEDHKHNLSQLLVFEPNSRMSLFQLLSWSFITLGCATILVGFCGCSAIFKNNRWILGLYIFLVLAIFALDLATGLLAIIFQEKLVANVRLRLASKLRADYGVQASFTAAIDYIQTKFECCGLEGHFDYDQSVWRLQRLGGFEATVARTCCHLRNTFDDQAHINPRPVNESMCQSTDIRFHQSYRYRKGCLDDLERLVRHKIWIFTMGCAGVGAVILISLMFATCFCRSIQSYSNSRKESQPVGSSNALVATSSPKQHLVDQTNKSPARHFTSGGQGRHHHHK